MFGHLWISLRLCSSCHISHLASTSMSKTLTYDPRVYIPLIPVHLRGMIKCVFVPVGKGLKLIRQLTVYIGIHIHCSRFNYLYSSVLYATCVVAAIIYHWVVTALCLSKVDRNKKYTL